MENEITTTITKYQLPNSTKIKYEDVKLKVWQGSVEKAPSKGLEKIEFVNTVQPQLFGQILLQPGKIIQTEIETELQNKDTNNVEYEDLILKQDDTKNDNNTGINFKFQKKFLLWPLK